VLARLWQNSRGMKYCASISFLLCLAVASAAFSAEPDAAAKENEAGLALHKKKKFGPALLRFQKAAELDPDKHIAHFNAACAASRAGQLDVAREHAERWLEVAPERAVTLLHDPDLERLRADEAWVKGLRARLRPGGSSVRPLVFEWREESGDLFTVGEDGLDRRPLAADPALREHDPRFSPDGKRLYYRATPELDLNRHYLDPGSSYRRFGRDGDELRVMSFPDGTPTTVATRVQHYRVLESHILLVDAPEGMRPRIRQVPVGQGKPETLATLHERSVAWCYAHDTDGSLVVASGVPDKWGRGLNLEVARWRGGEKAILVKRADPKRGKARIHDIQICALHDGVMELGNARVTLGSDAATVEVDGGLAYGQGAYNRRRRDSRGSHAKGAAFLTVDGTVFEVSRRKGPKRWAASPLMWTQTNGMSEDWWFTTRVVRWDTDGTSQTLTPRDVRYGDYGPQVSADGKQVAFTRLRAQATPWIVVADADGGSARLVAPGQYAIWGAPTTVETPGAALW
jgi:hypothetical protein